MGVSLIHTQSPMNVGPRKRWNPGKGTVLACAALTAPGVPTEPGNSILFQ